MTDNDREQRLQRLADENGYWAEEELRLIETIREHKQRLAYLPDIIRWLNEKLERVTAEMLHSGREHDALEAEDEDAEFRARANDEADELTDWRETARRPNY